MGNEPPAHQRQLPDGLRGMLSNQWNGLVGNGGYESRVPRLVTSHPGSRLIGGIASNMISSTQIKRAEHQEYFMDIAKAVRKRAHCVGNKVGAVVDLNRRIISIGNNGTPDGITNCTENGCYRCSNREKYPSGSSYDL